MRGETDDPFEGTCEVALVIKTKLSRNLRKRQLSFEQQELGLLETRGENVLMGRGTRCLFEDACKVVRAHRCESRQFWQREWLREVRVNVLGDVPQAGGWQAMVMRKMILFPSSIPSQKVCGKSVR